MLVPFVSSDRRAQEMVSTALSGCEVSSPGSRGLKGTEGDERTADGSAASFTMADDEHRPGPVAASAADEPISCGMPKSSSFGIQVPPSEPGELAGGVGAIAVGAPE